MSLLNESFTLGDMYLIGIKLDTDKWDEYFRPELFKECPNGESSEIRLVKNIIEIVSGFEEYLIDDESWPGYAADLFTCETKLGSTRFTPVDGEIEIVAPNYQTGKDQYVLTIYLNKDKCPAIF